MWEEPAHGKITCRPSAKCRWGMQVDASALFVGAGVGVSGPETREREKKRGDADEVIRAFSLSVGSALWPSC